MRTAASISTGSGTTPLGVEDSVIKGDMGKLLLKLEELQEKELPEKLEPKKPEVVGLAAPSRAVRLTGKPRACPSLNIIGGLCHLRRADFARFATLSDSKLWAALGRPPQNGRLGRW